MDYKDIKGFKNNSILELAHSNDDNPYYVVYGYWTYYAKGCGVFYNIGKSLRSYNKLNALYMIGFSTEKIVDLIKDSAYMINNGTPYKTVKELANNIFPHISTIENQITKLVEIAAFPPYNVLQEYNVDILYQIDRVNNSADWDQLIAQTAHDQGYDSIQFLVQANGNGGWACEIVIVGMKDLVKAQEITWKGWDYINNIMSIMDPTTHNNVSQCKFDPTIKQYQLVTCPQQNVTDCISSIPIIPPYYNTRKTLAAQSQRSQLSQR